MKLINSTKNETVEIDALGLICGRRCDSVDLNQDDLTRLLSLSPMQLHDRISEIRQRITQCAPKKEINKKLLDFINDPKTIAFSEYCNGGPVPLGEEYLEEMARKDREKDEKCR